MSDLERMQILVPTDFSEPAANALRYASALASASHSSLKILHADPFIPAIDFTAVPAGEFGLAQQKLVAMAKLRLEAHVQKNVDPMIECEMDVAISDPVNAIIEACRSGVDLLVMGTHGRTGVPRLIFGSVTAAVMRLAPLPVLAVTEATPRPDVRNIACPVSYTAACREALRQAASLFDARIVLLAEAGDDPRRLQEWIPTEIEDRCSIQIVSESGDAGGIAKFARINEIDLIALAVPADRRVMDSLRGTIAEQVIQLGRGRPVLTVNPVAAEANAYRAVARQLV